MTVPNSLAVMVPSASVDEREKECQSVCTGTGGEARSSPLSPGAQDEREVEMEREESTFVEEREGFFELCDLGVDGGSDSFGSSAGRGGVPVLQSGGATELVCDCILIRNVKLTS